MDVMDIYLGEESNDVFDIDSLAALYNCKVIEIRDGYATLEGSSNDLDQFARFWSNESLFK